MSELLRLPGKALDRGTFYLVSPAAVMRSRRSSRLPGSLARVLRRCRPGGKYHRARAVAGCFGQ
jgi:hypothetical protein